VIIIFLIAIVVALGLLKWMGMRAMSWRYVEVSGLTAAEIADIGTKASESMLRRMRGRAKVYQLPDGALAWSAKNGGGVLSFIVTPLPNGQGYRVGGRAEELKVAQQRVVVEGWVGRNGETILDLRSDYLKAKILVNWIFWKLGIPSNARALLMRRHKTLNAIVRAGAPAGIPAAAPAPAPVEPPARQYGTTP
jgi:hypothetical protein